MDGTIYRSASIDKNEIASWRKISAAEAKSRPSA